MHRNQSNWRKTITLSTGTKNAEGFRKAIKDGGMRISYGANDIFGNPQFTVTTEPTEVNLVIVTVAELGLEDGATLRDIYQAAKKRGYELCPDEVGPQLRLQYHDQPLGERLVIGMEPITASTGYLRLFCVGHGSDGWWLDGYCGYPDDRWGANRRFVFVLPSN